MAKNEFPTLTVVDHPLIESKLATLRDENTPSADFRRALHELSYLLAFPVMAKLKVRKIRVRTPLEEMEAQQLADPAPCIVSILRAGNGLVDGFSQVLPEASIGHLGVYRDHETTKPVSYYKQLPENIASRQVILGDPMLATGGSALMALDVLHEHGVRDIVFACLVAAPEGVAMVQEHYPEMPIFTAALDRELNEQAYIMPGLGDAGDRIYDT